MRVSGVDGSAAAGGGGPVVDGSGGGVAGPGVAGSAGGGDGPGPQVADGPGDGPVVVVARDRVHSRRGSGGRPRSVQARYGDGEYAVVAAAAARAGLAVSAYVAEAALALAGQGEPPGSVAVRAAAGELMAARVQLRRYAVNLNQAVAALHSTGQALGWLRGAVAGADRAVRQVDDAAAALARAATRGASRSTTTPGRQG